MIYMRNLKGEQNTKEGDFELFISKFFTLMNDKLTSLIVKHDLMWLVNKMAWNKTSSLDRIVSEVFIMFWEVVGDDYCWHDLNTNTKKKVTSQGN
jgi:hypothetical protein